MFSLGFTVLQKWVPLEVKDTSFVKLPTNKTVFTDLLMAAQGHRDAFTAPVPFTYHHHADSKSKVPRLASEAKAQASEQRAAILMKPSDGFAFKVGRGFSLAATYTEKAWIRGALKSHMELQIIKNSRNTEGEGKKQYSQSVN